MKISFILEKAFIAIIFRWIYAKHGFIIVGIITWGTEIS